MISLIFLIMCIFSIGGGNVSWAILWALLAILFA